MRYIVKKVGGKYGVYDTVRGSYPYSTPWTGKVKQDHARPADAIKEAERLNKKNKE